MKKHIRFLNLSLKNNIEKEKIINSITSVLDHGYLVMGPEIDIFEKKISLICKRKFAIAVGSGTDALYLAIKALNIKKNSEVITTSLSWIATANAIALNNLKPVFADINDDLNISVNSVESLISAKTKALVVVNYTGKIAEMNSLIKICKKHKIYLIEDGSQSFGAKYNNLPNGSFGIVSAISHNPMKLLGAIGEAGSILTNNKKIKNKLISLRYNGTINKETCIEPSLNGRMDTIQAAVLLQKLKFLKSVINKRRINASYYTKMLKNINQLDTPYEKKHEKDIYYTYTIRAKKRDKLREFLTKKGIETKIQHPILMPLQPAYRFISKGSFSNAKIIVKQILCLPIHEKLNKNDLEYVVRNIKEFYNK